MFYLILGFGLGFYACYLTLKIKQVRKEKKQNETVDVKVSDNKTKVENEKK